MRRTYKITPVSLYDVRGLESWLEDMARRGLFLQKLRPALSVFARGQAQSLRYRVEPCRRGLDGEVPQTMLDLYQDFGWEYVCSVNAELLVFSTRDPDAPEPHSDPELQGQLWKKLYRSRRRAFFVDLAVVLLLLVLVPYLFFGKGMPVLMLLTTTVPILTLYLPLSLVVLPGLWADVQRLDLLVRQLENGVPLDHRNAYPRRRWQELIHLFLYVVLLASMIVGQMILPFLGNGIRPLDELTAFVPLSLAEVEGESFTPYHFIMNGRDYSNFCAVDHSLLCQDQWEVVQTGGEQTRITINWYDLPGWLSPLSAPLAQELLSDAMGLKSNVWWTSPEEGGVVWTVDYYTHFDDRFLAVAREDRGFQIAAVSRGGKAAIVKYTGNGDLADHLDEIMAMVQ